jgi:hypothetical protein
MAELTGVVNGTLDIDGINRAYYVNEYFAECWTRGYGDDGQGVPFTGCPFPPCPVPAYDFTVCYQYPYPTVGANSDQIAMDCFTTLFSGFHEGHVVCVDVRMIGRSDALQWATWSDPASTHMIAVRVYRLFYDIVAFLIPYITFKKE